MKHNNTTENLFEKCISCGRDTNVPRDMDVGCRKYYIMGLGQLCEECYDQIEIEAKAF